MGWIAPDVNGCHNRRDCGNLPSVRPIREGVNKIRSVLSVQTPECELLLLPVLPVLPQCGYFGECGLPLGFMVALTVVKRRSRWLEQHGTGRNNTRNNNNNNSINTCFKQKGRIYQKRERETFEGNNSNSKMASGVEITVVPFPPLQSSVTERHTSIITYLENSPQFHNEKK